MEKQNLPLIVAIPGAGMNAGAFVPLLPHLDPLRLQGITLPGHDPRLAGPSPATIADMARAVEKDLDAARPAVLMGHSMGALAALEAAAHPAVRGLVLMGAAALMPVHPDLLRCAAENPAEARDMILKWGVSRAHPDPAGAMALAGESMKALDALHADLAACASYGNAVNAAPAFGKPVLVIAGADDKMVRPEAGEALAALFPQGRFCLLPATGHMMMAENPAGTGSVIREFCLNFCK